MVNIKTSQSNGHVIEFNEKDQWVYSKDKKPVDIYNKRKCLKCKKKQTKEGYDYCIANLPGVAHACCGHGVEEGYIMFENAILIRGYFEVEDWKETMLLDKEGRIVK